MREGTLHLQAGLGVEVNGAYGDKEEKPEPRHVTHDELYLAGKLNEDRTHGQLTPAAIQRLNNRYGTAAVVSAMRLLRGYTPDTLRSPYAYLEGMLRRTL